MKRRRKTGLPSRRGTLTNHTSSGSARVNAMRLAHRSRCSRERSSSTRCTRFSRRKMTSRKPFGVLTIRVRLSVIPRTAVIWPSAAAAVAAGGSAGGAERTRLRGVSAMGERPKSR